MKKLIFVFAAALVLLVLSCTAAYANILGDVDGDGILTANDASFTLQRVLDADYELSAEQLAAADVTGDGEIMADDAAAILQKVLDDDYTLPAASAEASTETTTAENTVYTANLLSGLKAGSNDDILQGLYAGEDMDAKVETVETDESIGSNYVQGTTNPTVSNNIPTAGAYIRYTAPADGVLTIKIKTSGTKTTKFVFADGSSAYSDIVNSSSSSRFDIVQIQLAQSQVLYIYAVGSKTSIFGLSFETNAVLPTIETTTQTTTEAVETTTKALKGDVDTSDGVVVSSFSELKSAVNSGESKIYVKGTIDCDSQLTLSKSNANITIQGLTNEDDTAAVLDFETFLNSATARGESKTGVYIKGSYYNFKNIIIQNAPDCGLRIKGTDAGNCTFENCVFRYNNNSGTSVTSGAHDNYFKYCDSYRNGDIVNKCGDDADGFSVKLDAGAGNKYYNCRAWENSDDGWDSYESTVMVPEVYYEECLAWHNGNPETFTGEYDYENGYPLDKNLLYVKQILKEYPDFEEEYNAHTVTEWPQVTLNYFGNSRTYSDFYSTLWGGNPNGFKLGSSATPSTTYRYIKNCIAFDHFGNKYKEVQYTAKGFDQNGGSASYDLVNALSFNNTKNYEMDKMTLKSVEGNVWSFNINNTPEEDTPSDGLVIETPSEEKQAELAETVYAYRDMIYSYVYNDIIPGEQLCNVFD